MKPEWTREATLPFGIICGVDEGQEWLLPWWWSRYSALHNYPVTFCDFGMSPESKRWCEERGEVIPIAIPSGVVALQGKLHPRLTAHAETLYGQRLWSSRPHWFKKPFAILSSRYEKGLWLDVDCEILRSIESVASCEIKIDETALVRDYTHSTLPSHHAAIRYNGGVILFQHGNPLMIEWAEKALSMNHLFIGDDQLLSYLIQEGKASVKELPEIYNWKLLRGINFDSVILHWVGEGGKEYVRKYGGIKPLLEGFFGKVS